MIFIYIIAGLILSSLSFYTGSLLFKLQQQEAQKKRRRLERIANIVESIQTISLAMEQQQCNMSEGCIRLVHLLDNLPLLAKPQFDSIYPGIYSLYQEVKLLPTHAQRNKLTNKERNSQDLAREATEAELETVILKDVARLKSFSI